MKRTKFLYFVLIFILLGGNSFGQHTISLSTSSRKAKKHYEKAEYYLQKRNHQSAILSLQNAIKLDNEFVEALLLLGELYENTDQDSLALTSYEKVMKVDSNFYNPIYYYAGELAFKRGEYLRAKNHFKKYLQANSLQNKEKAEKQLANCTFAIEALKHPVNFEPMNMGSTINTDRPEYFPAITADNSTFLFTRMLRDSRALQGQQEDFFISYKKDSIWQKSENIGLPINTPFNEGAPNLSPDGNILFFTACETPRGYGPNRNGLGRCDIFYALKEGTKWTVPRNLGEPINSKYWDSQPSFSSDGKTLYFVSNRDNGYNIFVSELGKDKQWSEPKALSDKINSEGIESSVFIHPDNQTLYFASNGFPGMGGMDLFYSKKDSLGEWQEAVNLGYPINTNKDENSILISSDGKTAYFASDRKGGFGDLDIYQFDLPKDSRPQEVSYLEGLVFDKNTKEKLKAKVDLINKNTGLTTSKSFTNRKSGDFLVTVLPDQEYILNVSSKGYLFYSDHIFIPKETDSLKPIHKDIPLTPIQKGEKIVMKNIFFDSDQWILKPASLIELKRLYQLLQNNPSVKIEIGGHTDNTGSNDHNLTLSNQRAESVYKYLIDKGITPNHLSFKGYGSNLPITTNNTEEGRAMNRRTEIMVIE